MSDKEINKSVSAQVPPKPIMPAANNIGYVSKTRGFPVQEGQTWHDLTPAQRKQWFYEHENRWKTRFGAQNRGLEANMNWTRG
jgi:hypothetical protein